jgi:hypothetical protein
MDTFNGGPYQVKILFIKNGQIHNNYWNFQPFTLTPRVATDPTPFSAPIHETNGTTLVPKEPLFAETPKRPATNGTIGPPVYYSPETNNMFTKTPPDAPLLIVAYLKSDLKFRFLD